MVEIVPLLFFNSFAIVFAQKNRANGFSVFAVPPLASWAQICVYALPNVAAVILCTTVRQLQKVNGVIGSPRFYSGEMIAWIKLVHSAKISLFSERGNGEQGQSAQINGCFRRTPRKRVRCCDIRSFIFLSCCLKFQLRLSTCYEVTSLIFVLISWLWWWHSL